MSKKPAYSKYLSHPLLLLVLLTFAIFLILLPLAQKVNFMQNDDWIYYEMVGRFLKGDFTLHPYVAASFYSQGILGVVFAGAFGLTKLPILTLIISCLNFLVFTMILNRFMHKGLLVSVVGGLLFFANPLHIYSTWSFMTENYFLFFLLVSIYFVYSFSLNHRLRDFIFANIFIILGYLVRQLSLIASLGFAIYLLFNKKYKLGLLQLGILFTVLVLHYNLFPLTPAMYDGNLEFYNLFDLPYLFTNIAACLIYVAAFSLPLLVLVLSKSAYSKKNYILCGVFFILAMVVVFKFFNPKLLSWGEFPYYQNTVERKGFYPRDIEGTKYSFRFIYDLYLYWEIAAKLGACLLATYLFGRVLTRKFSPAFIFFAIYLGILLITPDMYDRYLLPLVMLGLLLILEALPTFNEFSYLTAIPFLLFIMFYSYMFSQDFVIANNYIWNKSQQLVSENLKGDQIYAGYSWRRTYGMSTLPSYKFSYDSLQIRPEDKCCWEVSVQKDIEFPFNLFINPKIYLYKRL